MRRTFTLESLRVCFLWFPILLTLAWIIFADGRRFLVEAYGSGFAAITAAILLGVMAVKYSDNVHVFFTILFVLLAFFSFGVYTVAIHQSLNGDISPASATLLFLFYCAVSVVEFVLHWFVSPAMWEEPG